MRRTALLLAGGLLGALAILVLPDLLGKGLMSHELDVSALGSGRVLGALGIAWLGGVLTSLTPCVYPLIPITLGIFGARQAESRLRSFALVTCYVLGIAVMFSALGFVAASSGQAFGTVLSNPWVVTGLALFFAAMAASMFGAFELTVPQGLAQRLNRVGGAGFGGAIAMGLVAGIIAAPCTGPVLASLLTVVATSGQPVFGFILLFFYALGIGLPFFLLGVFSVSLPKSGAWMDGVKSVFGVALLAMAILYLRDAFPAIEAVIGRMPPALVVGPAIVAIGIFAGAIHRSFHGAWRERLLKGAGVVLVVAGIVLRLGGAPAAESVPWHHDYEAALATARAQNKPVMIDFYADWCGACKELDKYTYTDDRVIEEAARFVPLKVDGTIEDEHIETLYAKYGIKGLPTVLFLDPSGKLLEKPRITGFLDAGTFLEKMQLVH